MKGRSLLALAIIAIVFGCEGSQSPTAPGIKGVALDPSAVFADGAHGGNADFFFLPPLVPLPLSSSNFQLGRFDNTLRAGLRVEICKLSPERNTAGALVVPLASTACLGDPLKKFLPGSVQVVNLPLRQNGWWTLLHLPADGFYYVLWDTHQSIIDPTAYYRIKVFADGISKPLGFADVDPMSNLREWKSALTGEVIQVVNGSLLPIPFRVEQGALCNSAVSCTSVVVTNHNPTDDHTIVTVPGNDGAPIAGASFPDGWLPTGPGRPTSVIVTISSVPTGPDNADGTESIPCHPNRLEQFKSCFKFSTTPVLAPVADGHEFVHPVTVAVCYVLHGKSDPRRDWVQLWASGPGETTRPLKSVVDNSILTDESAHDCGTNFVTVASSNPVMHLANAGWEKLKGGLSRVFGVETAYAVDVGLGGTLLDFTNIGPALTAEIRTTWNSDVTVNTGTTHLVEARIVGTQVHNGDPLSDVTLTGNTHGIPGLPLTFKAAPGNGTLTPFAAFEAAPGTEVTVTSSHLDDSSLSGGFARVSWTVPNVPGIYHITADGPATNGPVTFTATVVASSNSVTLGPTERRMLSMVTGATLQLSLTSGSVASWVSSDNARVQVSPTGLVTALVGGDITDGTAAAAINTVLTTGLSGPTFLVNSFSFDIFPRNTTLAWLPVPGAASYHVVTEHGEFCSGPTTCAAWVDNGLGTATVTDVTYTFGFVGAQPGRWRVTAFDGFDAQIGVPSPDVYYAYNI
ncbi:MAG: eukaryotic-like serine/threonine-protein kinase [Gemmatimonadaceae bacterium]|jgi:hypothetical protein|nr:eukaryotic-like serine/threonine-protein kinase [Gemmatimonadaceae bacterium]